ncbi:MAG: hypothetical protein LUH09_06655 [Clostridiales bacterium]|nr:hypothetical protein [Clostridiales bacterium]
MKGRQTKEEKAKSRMDNLDAAYDASNLGDDQPVTIKDILEYTGISVSTLRRYVKESGKYITTGWAEDSEIIRRKGAAQA